MSVIWGKVWRDLAHNKTRTFLVVLSTTVGVFALGLVFGMSGIMRVRMTEDHRASIPAHINFQTSPFDQEVVEGVRREPGVADVAGETLTSVRWRLEGETEWRDGTLNARDDYAAPRMYRVDLLNGHWPGEHTLAVESQTSEHFNIPLGATIFVEYGGHEQRLPVEGIVHLTGGIVWPPPQFGGNAAFCVTPETAAWLTGREGFTLLFVRLESFSKDVADQTAQQIQRRLQRMGVSVHTYTIADPDVHWAQEIVDTVFLILTVLGVLSLGLSAFLIVNTMNAIVTQQVWQIGIMKVVGATFGRVVRVYLMTVLAYSGLALLLAIPLGAIIAYLMASWALGLFNITAPAFHVIPVAVGIQIVMGLATPVLAALVPVVGGARITPHQAISSYGLESGFGRGWLDHLIGSIRFLPRPLALSLRNTFRRKARIVLTLLALTLGGVMLLTVMSVDTSLNHTLDVLLQDSGHDVEVLFDRPYHTERLIGTAESVTGVTEVEVWGREEVILSLAGGGGRVMTLWGVPPDSVMFHPRIVGGRALLPEDDRAILLNSKIAADEGIQVGDDITLTVGGQELVWRVIGLILHSSSSDSFASFNALAGAAGTVNRGTAVKVQGERHDAESQQALAGDLRIAYTAHSVGIFFLESASQTQARVRSLFNIITYLLLAMAVLAAVVGGIGLIGTMSINVVERSREIGVMRAIGATPVAIARIFVGEGVMVGMLSWLVAVPLSYPGALISSNAIGNSLFQAPLDFGYSISRAVLWLAVVVVLSALASLWPALRATKVSVREALAYE